MEHREFICLNCGAKGTDTSRTQTKKFCDRHCNQAYHYKKRIGKVNVATTFSCIYNRNVLCAQPNCGKCGWNPAVEKQRKAAIVGG